MSFIDNNNTEYKLVKYREIKYLTDETLFQLANVADSTNTKWQYNILDQNNSDLLSSLIVPRSNNL